jgi:hypothetical protein
MDIFNFTQEGALDVQNETQEGNWFNPKPAEGETYTVKVRVLPWMQNPTQSIVKSTSHWFADAQGKFQIMSPCTGEGTKCPVSNRYYQLSEAKDPRVAKGSGGLSYQKTFGSLIQVINDSKVPENNGKIFKYKIPVKVMTMIDLAMKPSKEDLGMGTVAKDCLNPFEGGYSVILKVTLQGKNRNYDTSSIDANPSSILLDGKHITRTPDTEKAVVALLTTAGEENDLLEAFGYKPTSAEDLVRLKTIMIAQFSCDNTFLPAVELGATPAVASAQPIASAQPAQVATPEVTNTVAEGQPAQVATPVAEDNGGINVDEIVAQAQK